MSLYPTSPALPADLTQGDIWHGAISVGATKATGGNTTGAQNTNPWGKDGFTFGDLIDIFNPLQHIPVVSTLYRHISGDQIAPAAQFVGSGLLGGAAGLAIAGLNAAVEEATGRELGEVVVAALTGDEVGAVPDNGVVAAPSAEATHAIKPSGPLRRSAIKTSAPNPERSILASKENSLVPDLLAQSAQTNHGASPNENIPATELPPREGQKPGAIINKMFRPSPTKLSALAKSPEIHTSPQAEPKASTPLQDRALPLKPDRDAPSSSETQRIKSNLIALQTLAQDLRGMMEANDAYNANKRLKQLYHTRGTEPQKPKG